MLSGSSHKMMKKKLHLFIIGNAWTLGICSIQHLEKSHETKECLFLLFKKKKKKL